MSEQALFAPASRKQEMMLKAALEAQIVVIGGASKSCGTSLINFSNSVDISTRQY